MKFVAWSFQFRWVFWGLGVLWILAWTTGWIQKRQTRWNSWLKPRFFQVLLVIGFLYFSIAACAKYSQLWTLGLNGQDFWLFVDILEQTKRGGAFLSRFAPQGLGFVQHGSVHPMLTWSLLVPISSLIGATHAALLFNPMVMGLAGGMIALLARKTWGEFGALCFALAFWASTQAGKVLMYDVHPEVIYPVLVLGWLTSMGLDGSNRVRWVGITLTTLLCMGVKEDSFLVLGPWIFWAFMACRGQQRKAAILSGVLAVFVMAVQMLAVKNWKMGVWGPMEWEGESVLRGVSFIPGFQWSSPQAVASSLSAWLEPQGGLPGVLRLWFKFLVSRPWLSLWVLAPWVFFKNRASVTLLPLTAAYSVLSGPRHLWNYYTAPFLGSFWYCAILPVTFPRIRKNQYAWALGASLLLGSSSPVIQYPTAAVSQMKGEVKSLLPCLKGKGLVQPHLIGWVPLEKIWTDRFPQSEEHWSRMSFVLVSPGVDRFELSSAEVQRLEQELSYRPGWKRVGLDCQQVSGNPKQSTGLVSLWMKD